MCGTRHGIRDNSLFSDFNKTSIVDLTFVSFYCYPYHMKPRQAYLEMQKEIYKKESYEILESDLNKEIKNVQRIYETLRTGVANTVEFSEFSNIYGPSGLKLGSNGLTV